MGLAPLLTETKPSRACVCRQELSTPPSQTATFPLFSPGNILHDQLEEQEKIRARETLPTENQATPVSFW
jgi:hypothetical protein